MSYPQPPQPPQPQQPQQPQQGYYHQAQDPAQYPSHYAPQAGYQAAPRQNPFAGITVRDYLLDGVAVLLLLISLFLSWNAGVNKSTDHIAVIVIMVLTLFTVSIHYLHRAGVLPASLAPGKVHLFRVLSLIPYLVLAGVFTVLELIKVFKWMGSSLTGYPALGVAYFIGLAAVVLIALPRSFEVRTDNPLANPAYGLIAVRGISGLAGVTSLFATVFYLIVMRDLHSQDWLDTIAMVLLGLLTAAVLAAPAVLLRAPNTAPLLRILPAIGAAAALQMMIGNGYVGLFEPYFGLFLLPLIGAVAANPALAAYDRNHQELDLHQRTATVATFAIVPVAVLTLFTAITGIIVSSNKVPAGLIAIAVLSVFIVLAALVGGAQLRSNPAGGRGAALVAFGATAVIALTIVIIGAAADNIDVNPWQMVLLLGLPVIGVYSLVGPKVVRESAAANRPARPTQGHDQPAQWAQPGLAPQGVAQPAPPAPPAPAAPAAPQEGPNPADIAADPNAPGKALADIASNHPHLRPVIAANPGTYPELLQWLGSLGDPQVDAALATRGSSAGTPQ